jgi:hypothetical protein
MAITQDDWDEDESPTTKPSSKPKDHKHQGVIDSWDNYDTFKAKLKEQFAKAGVDVSAHNDEDLVDAYYRKLPKEKKEKFDYRYKLDRPTERTESAADFMASADAPITFTPPPTPVKSRVGNRILDDGTEFDPSLKGFAKWSTTPLTGDTLAKGYSKVADTVGLSKIPRSIRDPIGRVVDTATGLPALSSIVAPESFGETLDSQTTPLNLASTAVSLGRIGPGASSQALSALDRGISGLQTAEGLYSAWNADNRGDRTAAMMRAGMALPGMMPGPKPREAAAPPPLPGPLQGPDIAPPRLPSDPIRRTDTLNAAMGAEYFPEPKPKLDVGDPSAYFGGPQLEVPNLPRQITTQDEINRMVANRFFPEPKPPVEDPSAYFGGPRLQVPPPPDIPLPPPQGFRGQVESSFGPDVPGPLATVRPEAPYASQEGQGVLPIPGINPRPLPIPEPSVEAPQAPLPWKEQPPLFPNAGAPNFPPKRWTSPLDPQFALPSPKAQAPASGGTKGKLTLRNMQSGEASTNLIFDFAGGAVGGAVGGAIGGSQENDHPILGALMGAAIGAGLGHGLGRALGPKATEAQNAVLSAMAEEKKIAASQRGLIRDAKDPLVKAQIKQAYLAGLPNDAKIRAKASAYLDSPDGLRDYARLAMSMAKGNLLSSPTALVTQLFNFPNLAIRNLAIDPLRPVAGKILGNKADSGLAFINAQGKGIKEISPYYSAAYAGAAKGIKDAWHVLSQGLSDEAAESLLGKTPGATKSHVSFDFPHSEIHQMDVNPVVKAIGWPTDMVHRVVNALDVFPRAIARAQSEAMMGVTAALAEGEKKGLKGKALNSYVAKNYAKQVLTPEAKTEAGRRALEVVLQEDPDSVTRALINAKMNIPAIDALMPFVKSLSNAFRQSVETVPGVGAGVMSAFHDMSPEIKNEMLAKQGFGILALAGIAGAEATGRIEITGPEPMGIGARVKAKAHTEPYSIIWKNDQGQPVHSISYLKLPVVSALMATYAATRDTIKDVQEGKAADDAAFEASLKIGSYVKDQSILRLMKDTIDVLSGYSESMSEKMAKKAAANYAARQIIGYSLPMSGMVRSLFEKGLDDNVRKMPDPSEVGISGVFEQQLPWNYTEREPVLDWKGERVKRPGGPVRRMVDPLGSRDFETTGIQADIAREAGNEAIPGALDVQKSLKVNGQEVSLSRKQDFKRRQQIGKRSQDYITKLMSSDEFQKADKEQRGELIRKERTRANKDINEEWKQKLSKKD